MELLARIFARGRHKKKPRVTVSGQSAGPEQSTNSLPTIAQSTIDAALSQHSSTQSLPVSPPPRPPLAGVPTLHPSNLTSTHRCQISEGRTPALPSGSASASFESSALLAGGNLTVTTVTNNYEKLSVSSDVRQKIVDWLSPLNYHAIQKDTFEKVAKGTGEWLLCREDFKNWLSSSSGTLWGVGIPGAGKTYLTSIVINHLKEHRSTSATEASSAATTPAVIYAFCRYNDKLSASQILASLLAQLVDHSEAVAHYVEKKLYDSCIKQKTGFTPSEITAAMQSVIQLLPQVYIVIDALDELQDTARHELVDFLVTLQKSLFMTSRDIRLQSIPSHDFYIRPPFEDFRIFFHGKLSRLPHLKALFDGKKETLDEIIKRFEEQSDGMFLLAALQLSVLDGVTTISNLRKGLERLPKTLRGMYSLTLERIKAHEEEKKSLALRAILWITYATRSLELGELLVALATEPGATTFDPDAVTNEGTLISLCSGLLTVEKESGIVRLVHFTAQDFFTSYPFKIPDIPDPPHSHIATICATHLQISAYDWKEFDSRYNLRFSEFARSKPFCDYACWNLGHHLAEMLAVADTSTVKTLLPANLLSFLRWQPSLLLRMGAGQFDEIHVGTAVHFAAFHGLVPLIDQLPGDVNTFSTSGYTPLYYACRRGHTPMVDRLLSDFSIGVNDTVASEQQMTPLHVAAEHGHDSTVELLLATPSIDPNVQDENKQTALHLASRAGHDFAVRLLLATPSIDPNVQDENKQTALHLASRAGHDFAVRLLLATPGIDVNAQDEAQRTALHLASIWGHDSIVKQLLASPGIDVNRKNSSAWTALHLASGSGHVSVVQQLLSFPGMEINAPDEDGWTALHLACNNGNKEVVQLLLDSPSINANVRTTRYSIGSTALDLATKNGNEDIVALFRERGYTNDDSDTSTISDA